jgi:hypothetical protein
MRAEPPCNRSTEGRQQAAKKVVSRAYYAETVSGFLVSHPDQILGVLTAAATFSIDLAQRDAWREQVRVLQSALAGFGGKSHIYFEYSVPRLGKRIDAVVILHHVVFVIEFKVGERSFTRSAIEQVWDYALDLKNFHETTHHETVVPILVPTLAGRVDLQIETSAHGDQLLAPVRASSAQLGDVFSKVLSLSQAQHIVAENWNAGRYSPTPTIIEAARALYANHGVADISRNDAKAINLTRTTEAISRAIEQCRTQGKKAVCFVTGVPGAGKTLVGLNVATKYVEAGALHSVFLSGNGPLVAILREALARDKVRREAEKGRKITKGSALSEVKAFVQNVHHFRDEYLSDETPPSDHIAVFDEAQRAWNLDKTADFMRRKRGKPNFAQSEPEYLISCLDRHRDWAVVVCLVGGGQEINTGEAGIGEWLKAIQKSFAEWEIHISPHLQDEEYGAINLIESMDQDLLHFEPDLHLSVSMRSFRAEHVSSLVKQVLDIEVAQANHLLSLVSKKYPIFISRDLTAAKAWLRKKARGSERYGILVSSQAQRLRPLAIDVRSPTDPIHWFLDDKDDVRSSYYLEDVATEFDVQGLELDWTCVVWDGDFRYDQSGWKHYSFVGSSWQHIHRLERQMYLKNAYRVLLTRARQGMVIVVPQGDEFDHTRRPEFYDPTFRYLQRIGLPVL